MADPVKVHKKYDELIDLLLFRGMDIPDRNHAMKKISQVGYYRLSGFWYPCRIPHITPEQVRTRLDQVRPGTSFRAVYDLYLFDKKLRLLMMDALERIEVYVRSVIAHEIGELSPLSYLDDAIINPKHLKPRSLGRRSARDEWLAKHSQEIAKSREDCIKWHEGRYEGVPFWVAIEVWDFGLMSKYYAMLKDGYRNKVLSRLGITAGNGAIFQNWLSAMNVLRNRCAHHSRIWNKVNEPKLMPLQKHPYFERLQLNDDAYERLYGMIAILWLLLKEIGPGSNWINDVADLIDNKPYLPGCNLTAMGFPNNDGFPRELFGLME
ncbi:Abi family protein [Serratia sp. IR-2025]|uniref:Abi family protein n=1 Tax=Serratia TaxID=613 RepID=UPI00049950CF|nr:MULTISPECIES: Abi family protein [Serratia]AIA47168.1 Abi family protein [Serratia sp. FS14]EME9751675.1 Abi family protein [Serratia marcescens]MBX9334578.1 Abi family protein [Serratia marcescens]MDR8480486.1 Abi family protein [Serratia nevei]WMC74731.1 Abi family protein [Serratia nevei]